MLKAFYKDQVYKNVMEELVEEELDRQTRNFKPETANALNRVDVVSYALNRLPPLYAASQEGVYRQKQRGQQQFGQRLRAAVMQALKVVAQQPTRFSTPLLPQEEVDAEMQIAKMALEELADSMKDVEPDLKFDL
jgi:hypothetical protein